MAKTTVLWLIVVAGTVAVLGGCSGAGAPATDVSGASVKTVAADQLSAASLLHDWLAQLYVKAGPHDPNEVYHTDGNHHWGVDSAGRAYDYTLLDDGSGSGTWTSKSGLVETDTWGPTEFNDTYTLMFQDVAESFSTGFKFQFHWEMDLTSPVSQQIYTGAATVPSGQKMTFVWKRNPALDELDITLPDKSKLKFAVPVKTVQWSPYWPVFEQSLTGTYTNAAGATSTLKVTGSSAQEQWTSWAMTQGDTHGVFTLSAGLVGTGAMRRNGAVVGNLRWDQKIAGTLDLLGTGAEAVSPSAAARDFQMGQWVANASWLSPVPSY